MGNVCFKSDVSHVYRRAVLEHWKQMDHENIQELQDINRQLRQNQCEDIAAFQFLDANGFGDTVLELRRPRQR